MEKIVYVATNSFSYKKFVRPIAINSSKIYDVSVIFDGADEFYEKDISLVNLAISRRPNVHMDLVAIIGLVRYLYQKNPVLVVSLMPKAGLLVSVACLVLRINHIHTFTGQIWADFKGIKRRFYMTLDKFIISNSKVCLVDGLAQRNHLAEELGCNVDRLYVIWNGSVNGVDEHHFVPDVKVRSLMRKKLCIGDKELVFLFVGRIHRDKGVIDILKFSATLNLKHKVIFCGPLEIEDFRLPENCSHVGYVEDPLEFYQMADVLLLPSYREGFGNVVIEASACGLPVLGSDIYGLRDSLIDGVNGVRFVCGDVKSMVNAFKELQSKKEGLKGRDYIVENFSRDIYMKEYLKFLYNEIN